MIQEQIMEESNYWAPGRGNLLRQRYEIAILVATALYAPLLFAVQHFMKNRKPFQLKGLYFTWNVMLSCLSGLGVSIFIIYDPLCLTIINLSEADTHPYVRACISIFSLTKAIEFGDSFLLVLKKKPLRFLHVYHHLTVTLYCWHALKVSASFGHLFAFINLTIHSFMYLYFAIATLYPRHRFLVTVSSYITVCQTTQMFVGMYLSFRVLFRASKGSMVPATLEQENALFALLLYTSYAYLFILFYVERYIKNARPVMVFVVITLHLGGIAGAIYAWNHPNRCRIFAEIVFGYSLTAVSVHLCCHSVPRMIQSPNFLSLLVRSEMPKNSKEIKELSKENNGHTTSKEVVCREPLMQSCSTHDMQFTSTSKRSHFSKEQEKEKKQISQDISCDDKRSIDKTISAPVPATCNGLKQRGPVRQTLVLFNAWVLAALEKYQEKMTTDYSDVYKKKSHASLPQRSGLLKYSAISWLQLKTQDILPITDNPFIFFTASLVIPAMYGFLAHGNVLLGLLVHGCLRWVIELYTTGVLVCS